MTLVFAAKLGLKSRAINVGAQKINGLLLKTYSMTSGGFFFLDSKKLVWFFEKTFLQMGISIEMILERFFLFFNNTDIKFAELEKLT